MARVDGQAVRAFYPCADNDLVAKGFIARLEPHTTNGADKHAVFLFVVGNLAQRGHKRSCGLFTLGVDTTAHEPPAIVGVELPAHSVTLVVFQLLQLMLQPWNGFLKRAVLVVVTIACCLVLVGTSLQSI